MPIPNLLLAGHKKLSDCSVIASARSYHVRGEARSMFKQCLCGSIMTICGGNKPLTNPGYCIIWIQRLRSVEGFVGEF